MNDFLAGINWVEVLQDYDANLAASTVSAILLYAIDQFVPVKTKREPSKPAWSNSDLKYLKKMKRQALRRHSKYRTDSTRARYNLVNSEYKQLNDHLYSAHQHQLQNRLKSDPKSFWRHVNEQRKESGLPSTMTSGMHVAESTTEIAGLFRSQFSSVFSFDCLDPQDVADATENVPRYPVLGEQFLITGNMVKSACIELKSSSGFGPDGIPSLVLKRCMDTLATPLATVFNLSMATGVFPKCWKQSFVFPVFKKGCKRTVSNYRGIAALSATSKLFEIVVLHKLTHSFSQYMYRLISMALCQIVRHQQT